MARFRAPEPGDQCRPGGSCPECNAKPIMCADCGDEEVSEEGAFCAECDLERTCPGCGGGIDPGDKWCSDECRRADQRAGAEDAAYDLAVGK